MQTAYCSQNSLATWMTGEGKAAGRRENRVVGESEEILVDITVLFETHLIQIQDLEKNIAAQVLLTRRKVHPRLADHQSFFLSSVTLEVWEGA